MTNTTNIPANDPIFAPLESSLNGMSGVDPTQVTNFIQDVVNLINTGNNPPKVDSLLVEQINALATNWTIGYLASGAQTVIGTGTGAGQNGIPVGQGQIQIYVNPSSLTSTSSTQTVMSAAQTFVGALAYEVGHAEDPELNNIQFGSTAASVGNALSVGAETALEMISEGKSLYNEYKAQKLIPSIPLATLPNSITQAATSQLAILNSADYLTSSDSPVTGQDALTFYWTSILSSYQANLTGANPDVLTLLGSMNMAVTNLAPSGVTFTQSTTTNIITMAIAFNASANVNSPVTLSNGNSVTVSSYTDTFGGYGAIVAPSGTSGGKANPKVIAPTGSETFNFTNGTSLEDIYNPTSDITQSGNPSLTGITEEVAIFSGSSGSGSASNVSYRTAANASSVITVESTTPATTLANDTVVFDGNSIAENIDASGDDLYKRHYVLSGTTLTITGTGGSKDTVTINNFAEGDFGVNLPWVTTVNASPYIASAINNNGVTAGSTTFLGAVFTDSAGTITTSTPTGSDMFGLMPYGINDSDTIVGAAGYLYQGNLYFAPTIDNGGTLTPLIDPNAVTRTSNGFTYMEGLANAINDSGVIVGEFITSSNAVHGYIDNGGTYTTIDDPTAGATATDVTGINDNGVMAGNYVNSAGVTQGFIDNGGTFTTISDPNATGSFGTQITGVNNSQIVVGDYKDTSGTVHAFTYDGGTFDNINAEIAAPFSVEGITNSDEVLVVGGTTSYTATDQTPSLPNQLKTESNSNSNVANNTDSAFYGNSNTITGGSGDNISVFGGSTTVTSSGTGGTIALHGANDTANAAADILVTVDSSSTWDISNITGAGSGAIDSGTYSTINLDGSGDYGTLNGNLGSVQIEGGSASVDVTGNNDNIHDNGTGSSNITMGSYSNSAYLSASSSSATDNGTFNYIELDGTGETGTLNGTSGNGYTDGTGDTVIVKGSNNTGADEGAGGNTIDLEGNTDHGNMFNNGSTCNDTGTSDTEQLSGNSVVVNQEGSGGDATIYGTTDTVNVTGTGNIVFDLSASGDKNTVSLQGSGNTSDIYNSGADTITLGGTGNSLWFASGAGSGSTSITGTSAKMEIAGNSSESATFGSSAAGVLRLDTAEGFSGTVAGFGDNDDIILADFSFSGNPVISKVTGTGAQGTDTDVTITDNGVTAQIALLNQYANQFAVSASAYSLSADTIQNSGGTLFQLAAAH